MEQSQYFDALAEVPNLRSAEFTDLEIKDGGNVFLFDGLAAVYGQPADFGDFSEEVALHAYRNVIGAMDNVPMLHEHHPHQLLGTTKSGRVKLESETRGLRVRAKLVKTDLSSRVKALADSGDITGMSAGFVVGRGNHQIENRGGKPHRLITGFKKLLDVSTTWNPAFPSTEAQFRSAAMLYVDSPESWQQILMGAIPQLEEPGHVLADHIEESGELRNLEHMEASSRVGERQLAAAKRRISFLQLTGGPDHAS